MEKQPDGAYALRTASGNLVTAVGDGGLAHPTSTSDTLHTDATQIQAWERFNIEERSLGLYGIQTGSGFWIGMDPQFKTFSTRIDPPEDVGSIGYTALFEFMMLLPVAQRGQHVSGRVQTTSHLVDLRRQQRRMIVLCNGLRCVMVMPGALIVPAATPDLGDLDLKHGLDEVPVTCHRQRPPEADRIKDRYRRLPEQATGQTQRRVPWRSSYSNERTTRAS